MFASSAARISSPQTYRDLLWITLAASLLYLSALGARDLWNPNEPIYGRAVVEMAERGDWLVPSVNDRVFAEKPILYYWGALVAGSVTGDLDEFSLRLPCALAGIASALLTYLLALPYVGRRRALMATALFATQYQVFWVARAVQMDGFVLLTTLGALLPLTRMLDFGLRPSTAWMLTGLACGLGFAAKGPVTLILPGMVIFLYAAMDGRLGQLLTRHIGLGVLVGFVVAGPWYLALWMRGETEFLFEVLIRQNFLRFVEAWDHDQPWWYYLKYLWIDYLPWSWLLPAAVFLRPDRQDEAERTLTRLSWLWILAIIFFFSLSDSKRAPYIVPIGPAIAFLTAGVFDRISRSKSSIASRRLAWVVLGSLALIFTLVGVAVFTVDDLDVPESLATTVAVLGGVFLAAGVAGLASLAIRRRWTPAVMLAGWTTILVTLGIWALPQADAIKSTRDFAESVAERVDQADGALASYGFWKWRAGYSYYGRRSIPTIETHDELLRFWQQEEHPFVLVETRDENIAGLDLPGAELVLEEEVGGRTAALFRKAGP